MDATKLQDSISKGMGAAARKLGAPFIVYRPNGPADPLSSRNRVIRLPASFSSEDARYRSVAGYGKPLWWGMFDASYTRPGDYLVGPGQTFFIAAQRPLLPVQCVLTNRVVQILRPAAPAPGGYSGMLSETAYSLLTGWPASFLELMGHEPSEPAGSRFGTWTLLLPELPANPQASDLVVDDIGQTYVIGGVERSDLGWRIAVRQIAG